MLALENWILDKPRQPGKRAMDRNMSGRATSYPSDLISKAGKRSTHTVQGLRGALNLLTDIVSGLAVSATAFHRNLCPARMQLLPTDWLKLIAFLVSVDPE